MARKSKIEKREEQRARQAAVREAARESRRPDRDDVARLLLWLTLRKAHAEARKLQSRAPLDTLCSILVANLVRQGFDANEAEDVYAMLETKYRSQTSSGRVKRHLRLPGAVAEAGAG